MHEPKQIVYRSDAREKINRGIEKIADAVCQTLGPKGRNVILEQKYGSPIVTNDGVTIAREINVEDAFENMAVQLVKEAAIRTNDACGDGTTTAILLAKSIYDEGMKRISNGANPMMLKREIETWVEYVVNEINKLSIKVDDDKKIEQVATISANNDEEIGKLVAQMMKKVGNDGVVMIEESRMLKTTVEIIDGFRFNEGYTSPYFVNTQQRTTELENPFILIVEKRILQIKDLLSILQKVVQTKSNKPLLILADSVEGDALNALIMNKLKGNMLSCAVRIPGHGDQKRDYLTDISTLTGATIINDTSEVKLDKAEINHLGEARRIVITDSNTTIIGECQDKVKLKLLVESLKKQIESEKEDYAKEILQERLAKLTGGIGIIYVGAATETEMKEKKMRVEDSLLATKAAIEEGVLPGGGLALLRIQRTFGVKCVNESMSSTCSDGELIIWKALEAPIKTIMDNAGLNTQDIGVIIESILNNKNKNYGYDAFAGEQCDLMKKGIIDATLVVKNSFQNAASIAVLLLTSNVIVTKLPKKEDKFIMVPQGGV